MPIRALLAQARELASHTVFSIRLALDAISHNTVRAALASLGIFFGVASVIAMLAIGRGAKQEILEQMRLLGSNNVIVAPVAERNDRADAGDAGRSGPKRFSPGLTVHDARSIAAIVPEVRAVSGEVAVRTVIAREGRQRPGTVVGVDRSYFDLVNLPIAAGTGFTAQQMSDGAPVAIVGDGVRARFFTTESPIGRPIKVGSVWLTVVGVAGNRRLAAEVTQKLGIRDPRMEVYVPVTTMLLRIRNRAQVSIDQGRRRGIARLDRLLLGAGRDDEDAEARQERLNPHQLDRIIVQVQEARFVPAVADVTRRLLARRHNRVTDFEVTIPELELRQEQRAKTIFNVVLGAIASISLLVGGIGIMNIMLATVIERIREIGVRRAVGARRNDILSQFLTEAVMISLAGGIAGILLGVAGSIGIEYFAGIRTVVSPLSVLLASGVSITVGLAFGILPAWRAAQQDPVVSLRYE